MRIKDALKFGGLADGKVIAGNGGINKIIESISVLEVTDITNDDNGSKWLFKNQLYVTAFYAIKDDIKAQRELIKQIDECGGVGIVLCHIEFWVKKIDKSVIDLCNELDFPFILVPSNAAYTDIILPINDRLLKIYSEKYKYSLDIQSKLNELIIANSDIHDICNYISLISNSGIVIFDINFNTLSSNNISEDRIKKIKTFCMNNFAEIKKDQKTSENIYRDIDGKKYYIQPIVSVLDYFGLIALEDNSEASIEKENLQVIIKHTCIAIALICTKKQRFEKMQDIYFRDYLVDLLTWNFKDEQIAIKRGNSLNWDIQNKKLLVLININSDYEKKDMSLYENDINTIMPMLIRHVKEDNEKNLVGYRSDNIIILLEDDGDEKSMNLRAKKLSNSILEHFSSIFSTSISIGISNYYERISGISEAYKEALYAMGMGRSFSGENKVYSYSEFGYIPYFEKKEFELINQKMNDYFLKPLLEYDETHNSDLTNTLKNLLFYNQNIVEIAEKMFIHRNTLLARKKRIIEILKLDPFEMPNKINYLILFTLKNENHEKNK